MAQMGSRETEERVRSQPSAVAQAGATRPLPRFNGDQLTRENTKVACGHKDRGLGQLVFAHKNPNQVYQVDTVTPSQSITSFGCQLFF